MVIAENDTNEGANAFGVYLEFAIEECSCYIQSGGNYSRVTQSGGWRILVDRCQASLEHGCTLYNDHIAEMVCTPDGSG